MSVLAVDMGGTSVKVGLVRDGKIVRRESIVSHSEAGAAQALARLASLLRSMREPDCTGVGLALPTLVDVRINKVCAQMIGKFDGLTDVDFDAWSSREVGLPIRIENDAHAAILGEWRLGAGIGCDNLVMMTLGTGIGTSVIIGGRPLRGKHAQAGNLGSHMVMDPHGFKCVCGLQGCGEAQQHRSHIADIAKRDSRFPGSALSDAPTIDYAALFAHAADDELARDLLNRSLDIWGSIATSLVHQFDCERLIVGGGIMKSASIIMPHIQSWLDRACTPWGTCESRASELGDDAGLFGMASCFETSLDYI